MCYWECSIVKIIILKRSSNFGDNEILNDLILNGSKIEFPELIIFIEFAQCVCVLKLIAH